VFGALAFLSTFAQINPIWVYGPYNPSGISSGSQPDFYMGMLEGALRVWPSWSWNVLGHTLAFNVFIPALVPLGIIFTGAAIWPFLESWVTGTTGSTMSSTVPQRADADRDRIAAVTFYGILLLEGANDIIADQLSIPLFTITWIAGSRLPRAGHRLLLTKRICLGLQRKDAHLLEHGVETGIISSWPMAIHRGDPPGLRRCVRVLTARASAPLPLPAPREDDENGVPDRRPGTPLASYG